MKKFIHVLLVILLVFGYLGDVRTFANTDQEIGKQTGNMENPPVIQAQDKKFNMFTGTFTLTGNVVIQHKSRKISADYAEYRLTSQEVKANGHIEFVDGDFSARCERLYAPTRNNRAELSEGVQFIADDLKISSEYGEYNWKSKEAVFSGHVVIEQAGKITETTSVCYNVRTRELKF